MLSNHPCSQSAFSTRGCPALLQQAVPRRSSCCCAWQRALRKPSDEYVAAGMDPDPRPLCPRAKITPGLARFPGLNHSHTYVFCLTYSQEKIDLVERRGVPFSPPLLLQCLRSAQQERSAGNLQLLPDASGQVHSLLLN